MKVAVGADHAGFELKEKLSEFLEDERAKRIVKKWLETEFSRACPTVGFRPPQAPA